MAPSTTPERSPILTPTEIWSQDGILSRYFPDYESRNQQKEMYQSVLNAFTKDQHAVIEAGTGTGKTMAYLIPIILLSIQQPNKQFVVSTNTINLQQQLVAKDIPQAVSALTQAGIISPAQFRFQLLKGKSNYLCTNNFDVFADKHESDPWAIPLINRINAWNTTTGDRSEIEINSQDAQAWSMVSANFNSDCPYYSSSDRNDDCYLKRAREGAKSANLVIANHALFMADLANTETYLGHADYVVIDEAHDLEQVASEQFGSRLTEDDIKPSATLLKDDPVLTNRADAVSRAWHRYWIAMRHCCPTPEYQHDTNTVPIDEQQRSSYDWHLATQDADEFIQHAVQLNSAIDTEIKRAKQDINPDPKREALLRRARDMVSRLSDDLSELMQEPNPQLIQWMESSMKNGTIIHIIPMDVAYILNIKLFKPKKSVILTSATLATESSDFTLIRSRLGVPDSGTELALESPFDYRKQARFMSPFDIPTPNEQGFSNSVSDCLTDIARALDGKTLALFTSYKSINIAAKHLRQQLGDTGIRVLAQGRDGTPPDIIRSFRQDPRAIILGTASFWEGIDLSHDVLKAVVICRLPYPVPTDPIISARSKNFKKPFDDYHTPIAILRFRQGCGRLIRNRHSKGSIVVLDSRIRNPKFGLRFYNSLPRCNLARSHMDNIGALAASWVDEPT